MNRRNLLTAALAAPFAGMASAQPMPYFAIGKVVVPGKPAYRSFLLDFGDGPKGKLLKVWEDGRLIWEAPQ